MKKMGWTYAFTVALMITGCASLQEYLDIPREKGLSETYLNALESWTRSKTVYRDFETKIHVSATYRNALFLQAYQYEYARIYQEEKNKMDGDGIAVTDPKSQDFLFYAAVPDRDANNFASAKSTWRIYLVTAEGHKIKPIEIRKIADVSPTMEFFYPYINKYHGNTYLLKFPETPQASGKSFKIVFTGVSATLELSWS